MRLCSRFYQINNSNDTHIPLAQELSIPTFKNYIYTHIHDHMTTDIHQ